MVSAWRASTVDEDRRKVNIMWFGRISASVRWWWGYFNFMWSYCWRETTHRHNIKMHFALFFTLSSSCLHHTSSSKNASIIYYYGDADDVLGEKDAERMETLIKFYTKLENACGGYCRTLFLNAAIQLMRLHFNIIV